MTIKKSDSIKQKGSRCRKKPEVDSNVLDKLLADKWKFFSTLFWLPETVLVNVDTVFLLFKLYVGLKVFKIHWFFLNPLEVIFA